METKSMNNKPTTDEILAHLSGCHNSLLIVGREDAAGLFRGAAALIRSQASIISSLEDRVRELEEWKPMEDAPTDGSKIIVKYQHHTGEIYMMIAKWDGPERQSKDRTRNGSLSVWGGCPHPRRGTHDAQAPVN